MDYGFAEEICDKYGARYKKNEPLALYTSFKIGGTCPLLIMPNGSECLCMLVRKFKKEGLYYRVMGNGSNILVSDKGTDVPVIMISSAMNGILPEDKRLTCGSGTSLSALCRAAADLGLSGLEFAYGIPGSVGGAVYMNAGAYGGEMKDAVIGCMYMDSEGEFHFLKKEEMDFSYRHSFFSGKSHIIIGVEFELKKGDKTEINEKMKELMKRRKDKQPLEYPSAGSTFKRPKGNFAGKLIEDAGLKGFSVGGAQVSEKHCGFIVNKGGASFDDVKTLIETVREKVKENSGVTLEPEVLIWE